MADIFSKEKRSEIMAAVKGKNTGAELLVRRFLWANGIRYRLYSPNLPGKPDIVIPRCKLVIFIHGCFWHGHENCPRGRLPKSRVKYWKSKIEANRRRDTLVEEKLKDLGWRQIIIWDCQLRSKKSASIALEDLLKNIFLLCPKSTKKDTTD
jgi:DNA mismatch endonuclease (patch repair protein)